MNNDANRGLKKKLNKQIASVFHGIEFFIIKAHKKKKNYPLVSKKRMFQKKHDFNNVKFEGYFHPFNINNGPIKKNAREKFFKLFPSLKFHKKSIFRSKYIKIKNYSNNI